MQRITAYLSSLLFSRRDDGYSTETVIITAILVAAAAGVAAAIKAVVEAKVDEISVG
ncbi:hypothetical protein HNR06_004084 [Nocardiopsis arvandica]|uniref:Uncharacterized protein n=1 Tax=Nocardiopsis sinuspersici TaxID=501010 RepID=A0A7Z0BLR8_9ACTN|nr:hypothetical protein [Nocardiopsis sinuspersici]NYH54495.1 hypothetical protein [Nocardiopsis sinuspersici]